MLTTTLQNTISNTLYPTPCFFSPQPITLSHIHNLLVYYFSFCLLHYNEIPMVLGTLLSLHCCCRPPQSLAQSQHTVGPRETLNSLRFGGLALSADLRSCGPWPGLLSAQHLLTPTHTNLPHIQACPASLTMDQEP